MLRLNARRRPFPLLTVHEIQVVIAARHILGKYHVDPQALDDALAHLRALYALQRHGLKDYLLDTLGHKTAQLPVRRFVLYADPQGTVTWEVLAALRDLPLVDYLVAHAAHHTLPARIDLLATENGDPQQFFI